MREVDEQSAPLAVLVDAAALLSGARSMDEVLHRVVRAARTATGARYGALGVIGEDGYHSRFIHEGVPPEVVEHIGHLPRGEGVLGAVIRDRETVRVDDVSEHRSAIGFPDGHPPMDAFLGTPITFDGKVFGNIYLAEKEGGFTDEDEQVLGVLATMAGGAVEQARLQIELRQTAVQDERDRLARDLHDGVIQQLFSAGLTIEAAKAELGHDPDGARTKLDRVMDGLDRAVTDLRATLIDLHAHRVEQLPLADAIRHLVAEYERAALQIPVVEIDDTLAAVLGEDLVVDVVHIVREALSNAARHASATNVSLRLTRERGDLVIEVRDDGIGFDSERVPAGYGLINIAERAELHGGTAAVASQLGAGATVTVRLPVRGDHG